VNDLVKPTDAAGRTVDASFCVTGDGGQLRLYYASRGGTKGTPSARNTEYHIGLTLLLERMKLLNAVILDVLLDSRNARKLPTSERRLTLPSTVARPISLAKVNDVDQLRRAISESQKNVASASGRSPKHGNRMRSIEIQFRVGDGLGAGASASDVQLMLATGGDGLLPTDDPVILRERAGRILKRQKQSGQRSRPTGNPAPKRSPTASGRYLRLPSVVAYALGRAGGRCELCDGVPFLTPEGEPFLEVHHIHQLAEGGPDTPDNAVALCPNCHRELHYGNERAAKVRILVSRVAGLHLPSRGSAGSSHG